MNEENLQESDKAIIIHCVRCKRGITVAVDSEDELFCEDCYRELVANWLLDIIEPETRFNLINEGD